jgi:hypothetical protein
MSSYDPQEHEIDKVCAALVAAQGEFPTVAEGGENKFDKYKYARLEDYIKATKPVLAKHGLAISFTAVNLCPEDKHQTEKGRMENNFVVTVEALLIHSSGQTLRFQGYGQGIDRGDKAPYKAITGARKYLLASILNLATGDDPENESPNPAEQARKPAPPQQQQQRPPAQQPAAQAPQQPNRAETGMNAAAAAPPQKPAPKTSAKAAEIAKLSDEALGATLEAVAGVYANAMASSGATVQRVIQKYSDQLADKALPGADNAGYFYQFALDEANAPRHAKRMAFLRGLINHLAGLCEEKGIAWEIPVAEELAF